MGSDGEFAIEVKNLSYLYKKHRALDGLTFNVPKQSIHGFVGPNGAGKTTALKILSTLLRSKVGSVRVFGQDISRASKALRGRLGFMPDQFSLYRQMTVFEHLDFFAAAYGMNLKQRDQTVKDVLALTDMAGRQDDFIKGLSRGMQQRVSLARVLVHDPELLLLDEPASGLDPRARIELMEIIRELRRMGKTIFISSHILTELADLCDGVTIIDRGKNKFSGSMQELLSREEGDKVSYMLQLDALDEENAEPSTGAEQFTTVSDALKRLEGIVKVEWDEEEEGYHISYLRDRLDTTAILQAVLAVGGRVKSFREDRKHLNQAFMELTTPGVRT